MSSATVVPTSSRATAPGPFEEPFTKMSRAHCAAAPANDTKKRFRSSLNDEELCIIHGYVRDAHILPS
jgi:hypothetical protein